MRDSSINLVFILNLKKRHPEKHCVIRTDRLYVDHDYVYAWSERNQRIERLVFDRLCDIVAISNIGLEFFHITNIFYSRLITSSTCGSGGGAHLSGGLATAAAERSMLRTPASRYADTLMEMDEDDILA